MGPTEMVEEMAAVRELTAKPFGVDLLTAVPGQVANRIADVIKGGARVFVAGLGVPRDVIDLLHESNVLVGSMCGKVRHAVAAVAERLRLRRRPGHRGRRPHRHRRHHGARAPGGRRRRRRVPVVAAGGLFDGRGLAAALALGADGVWIGTRFIATPEARAVDGYKDTLLGQRRGRHGRQPGLHRQDLPRRAQRVDAALRGAPRRAAAVPGPGVRLGAGRRQPPRRPDGTEVDVRREFFPCGQGVGAIDELVPAGDLVRRMVAEAEAVIDRLAHLPR